MAGNRRMPREKATAALSAVLERICAGGAHADCVTAVYVFGSYARGALTVGDLADAEEDELAARHFVSRLRLRWRSPSSPLARAARAAAGYLKTAGVDLGMVALMPRSVFDQEGSRWAVDCRETHLRRLVVYLGHNGIPDALFVLRPERRRPLRALRLTASDPAALPHSDIEGWLSDQSASPSPSLQHVRSAVRGRDPTTRPRRPLGRYVWLHDGTWNVRRRRL